MLIKYLPLEECLRLSTGIFNNKETQNIRNVQPLFKIGKKGKVKKASQAKKIEEQTFPH